MAWRLNLFRVKDNIVNFYTWMNTELKLLPETMSNVEDYGATIRFEAILHLLEERGCDHFKAFGTHGFEFPSSEDLPAPGKIINY
jgi:hypothetical protein